MKYVENSWQLRLNNWSNIFLVCNSKFRQLLWESGVFWCFCGPVWAFLGWRLLTTRMVVHNLSKNYPLGSVQRNPFRTLSGILLEIQRWISHPVDPSRSAIAVRTTTIAQFLWVALELPVPKVFQPVSSISRSKYSIWMYLVWKNTIQTDDPKKS